MPSHQENLKQSNQFGNDLMFVCEPRVISHHSLATEMTPEHNYHTSILMDGALCSRRALTVLETEQRT